MIGMGRRGCSALILWLRSALPGPATREVRPADRSVAVGDHARDLEDHALQRRGGEHLGPGRLLRDALGRLAVVDLRPRVVEELAADQTRDQAEDEADRLVDELGHRARRYPVGRTGQSRVAYSVLRSVMMRITSA